MRIKVFVPALLALITNIPISFSQNKPDSSTTGPVVVYPNPVQHGQFQYKTPLPINTLYYTMVIYDMTGQVAYTKTVNDLEDLSKFEECIDLPLQQGSYIMTLFYYFESQKPIASNSVRFSYLD